VDARSGGCGRRSDGRAGPSARAAPAAAAGAAPGAAGAAAPPTPLRRLRAAQAGHEPRVMSDSQCNVHTAICVQYRGWIRQKNTYIEEHDIRYRSTKASISHTDIEGAFVDIEKSSISVYNDIGVLNFDIDISSSSISYCVDIEVPDFDIEGSSISYWFDIECYNLRYRRFLELRAFRHSISNVKTFDIEL
jgi:hypothetical protein